MDMKEALELSDRLIFERTGKHLSNLERDVFIGSWEGKTYRQIDSISTNYIEKQIGYKLWKKLSKACGEKMNKKTFRGALERAMQRQISLPQVTDPEIKETSQGSFAESISEQLFANCSELDTRLSTPSPINESDLSQEQVRLDSAFYVERVPYEAQCYSEILRPGALIRIKAPRQMGKTLLMQRILDRAKKEGYRTVSLNFQHADAKLFSNLNEFLKWFCSQVTRKLRLSHQVEQYWTDTFGSKNNCTIYFEDLLLSGFESPLVLGLDAVDRIFPYPGIADDFFGLLRAWYEEAGHGGSDNILWEKLRLVVVHSTEAYLPMDVNQSPFNVGLPVELSEFNSEQVLDLAVQHGLNWQIAEVEQLMAIVGGHPCLIRLALHRLAQQYSTLTQLLEIAPTEAGIYGEHLREHLQNLKQHLPLANAFSRVVNSETPVEVESVLAFKLHSLGLVHLQGNEVTPRLELYRQYFGERL
jgi:hypothetical protein